MLKKLSQYYQIFCNLSLDVAAGVFFSLLSLTVCFRCDIPQVTFYLLPCSTCLVYILDHVLDVIRKKNEYPTPRHRFIKKNLTLIIAGICVIGVLSVFEFIIHFDKTLFVCGIIMFCVVIVHFVFVQINPQVKMILNNKEFAVSFIYATGIYIIFFAEIVSMGSDLTMVLVCYLFFLSVTFINLLMTSLIEHSYDVQMQNSSFVIAVSEKKVQSIFYFLVGLVLIAGMMIIPFAESDVRLLICIYLFIALSHFYIYRNKNKFLNYLAYRKIGEVLFWLPGLVYLIYK